MLTQHGSDLLPNIFLLNFLRIDCCVGSLEREFCYVSEHEQSEGADRSGARPAASLSERVQSNQGPLIADRSVVTQRLSDRARWPSRPLDRDAAGGGTHRSRQ